MTRRCTQRQLLLRPDQRTNEVFLYCLGEAAARFDVSLHAWVAMSNHHHVLLRDNRGNLPEFLAHFHKMVAKAMNAHRGRTENLWASEQPSAVWVVKPEDCLRKLVYVLANPVAADLVERVADWPGAISLGLNLSGRVVTVARPPGFFRDDGPMPSEVSLRAERIEGFEHVEGDAWRMQLESEVETAERAARSVRLAAKRAVLGRKAVLNADPAARPSTQEPPRTLRPRLACRDGARRARELGLIRAFREAYQAALVLWRGGVHAALFPIGTYRMRWFGAVVGNRDSSVTAV